MDERRDDVGDDDADRRQRVGGGLAPTDLTVVGGTLYFAANDGVHGTQLWSSDGTAAGRRWWRTSTGRPTADVTNLTAVNGTLYFTAYTPTTGYQVWQSDGTAARDGDGHPPGDRRDQHPERTSTAVGAQPVFHRPRGGVCGSGTPTTTQTPPTITWTNPAGITYGTALSSAQLDATANVPGTFTYSPAAGAVLKAGTDTLSVTFTPTDTTDYTTATKTVTIAVAQATPTITWANPAGITYGTALSSAQLDATANVPGTFTYSPAAGTVLSVGTDTLSVTFTPTDTTDYATTTKAVTIVVLQAATATFLRKDTTTKGNWIGTYGTQGYDLCTSSASLPSYATITPAGALNCTWASSTTVLRALQAPGGGSRLAACWYQAPSFSVAVNLNDGQVHDLELYFLDWLNRGRIEQVQVTDAASGAVLSTQTVSSFNKGVYLDFAVSGDVVITMMQQAGPNAVLSGLFLDPSVGGSDEVATTMVTSGIVSQGTMGALGAHRGTRGVDRGHGGAAPGCCPASSGRWTSRRRPRRAAGRRESRRE